MPQPRNGSTRKGRADNRRVLAASRTCHLCGHDGADAVDHVIPLALGGPDTIANKRPAHHGPCPTCHRRCNLEKGAKAIAPIVRRSGSLRRVGE